MQVLTGEVTRLTAALEQAQREANAAGQARAEVDDLSTQVGHSLLSAPDLSPFGYCSSVQHTPRNTAPACSCHTAAGHHALQFVSTLPFWYVAAC